MTLTHAERVRIRSRIGAALCNLQAIHAFWSPSARRFFARSTKRTPEDARRAARGAPPLPADAAYFGTYEFPMPPSDVFGDLEDVLACPRAPARPAATRGKLAAPKAIPETRWKWAPERYDRPFGTHK